MSAKTKTAKPTVLNAPIAPLSVHLAVAAVMQDIKPIEKLTQNTGQKFWFRGIDDIMAALHPIFAAHGIAVVPGVPTSTKHSVVGKTSKGNDIFCAEVSLPYTIIGPQGDSVPGGSAGVAFDSQDKAMPKALTMAFKSFLTQAFTIPVYDTPDADSYDPTCIPHGDQGEDLTKLADDELERRIQQVKGEQTAAVKSDNADDLKDCVRRRGLLEDEQQRRSDEARKTNPPVPKGEPKETPAKATRAPRGGTKAAPEPETPADTGTAPQGAAKPTSTAVAPTDDWKTATFDNLPIAKWNGVPFGEIPVDAFGKMKRGWVDKYAENIASDPIKKHTATVILAAYNATKDQADQTAPAA